ncbi:MAG: hypothetical protein ACI82Q_002065, partial [Nonlabens sp.]
MKASNKIFSIIGLIFLLSGPILAQNGLQILPSSVLADNTDEQVLREWLLADGVASGTLLYRKSNDGNSGTVFHQKVDGQGPTLVLIKLTNGTVFGGYNPNSWKSDNTYSASSTSFVFNLTTDQSGNIDSGNTGNATYNRANNGPSFGGGHDIYLDASMSNGYVRGWSYNAVDGSGHRSSNSVRALTGINVTTTGSSSINGLIADVEVYKIEYNVSTPNLIGQDITISLDENGQASISASDIDNGSSDADGTVSLSIDITDFSCDDLGGSGKAIEPIEIGSNNISSRAYGGGFNPNTLEYWFPEWSGTNVYRVSQDGVQLGVFNSGQNSMMQLWMDADSDTDYYTANWGNRTITKRSGSSTIWSYDIGTTASGVSTYGDYVYAKGHGGNLIYVLDKQNGQLQNTISLNGVSNMNIQGSFAVVNETMYIGGYANSGTSNNNSWNYIHQFDLQGNYLGSTYTSYPTYYGWSFDGEVLWISNYNSGHLGFKISDGFAYGGGSNAVTLTAT